MSRDLIAIENLEQFDYLDNEYLERVIGAYSRLIGLFLIKFSYLEHEINLAIADVIQDRAHDTGYIVIERLTVANKIDLFYRLYLQLAAFGGEKDKERLLKIKKQLEHMNTFRNNIVHANWQSLTKTRYVRTKIMMDPDEGQIKFRNIKIDTQLIRSNIRKIDSLINRIDTFKEKVYESLWNK